MKRLKSYGLWRPTGKSIVRTVPENEWSRILNRHDTTQTLKKWRQAMAKEKETVLSRCQARGNDQPKEDN